VKNSAMHSSSMGWSERFLCRSYRLLCHPDERSDAKITYSTNQTIAPHIFHSHAFRVPYMSLQPGFVACMDVKRAT
jgi:hypothetical protein